MSFFPLIRLPGVRGWTTVYNFSPNNFEAHKDKIRFANISWSDGSVWHHKLIQTLQPRDYLTIDEKQLPESVPVESLPIISLTQNILPDQTFTLEPIKTEHSILPAWRGTIGITSSNGSKSSYQGEIDPFPNNGSCLTFNYLIQNSEYCKTILLLLNIESQPAWRPAQVEVRHSLPPHDLLLSFELMTNRINILNLPKNVSDDPNVVIFCREASCIPIFMSCNEEMTQLSFEHSHPPASSVVHGNRFAAQKLMKTYWFSKLSAQCE